MPRLSILLPCLGETSQFENTLASVLQNRPVDCEILVAHNVPYNDPYQLGNEVCFIHVPEAKSMVSLLNAGFEASRSAVVHVLQSGVEVPEDWVEGPLAHFEQETVAIVTPLLVHAQTPQRVLAAGWDFTSAGRCFLNAAGSKLNAVEKNASRDFVAPTFAAGFYRRSLWRFVRWDATVCDEFAPLALAIAARELGFAAMMDTRCVIACDQSTLPPITESFGYTQAAAVERLFWRTVGEPGAASTLAMHYGLLCVEFLAALPSPRAITGLLGRWSGIRNRDAKTYHAKLAEIRARMLEQEQSTATVPFQNRFDKVERSQRKAA